MPEDLFSITALLAIALVGLIAGMLGGMLGIGGSAIMIPGLTIVFGYNQHLYQAAAMAVNVVISLPAALRHRRAGAIQAQALRWMIPAALLFVLLGVWVSNLPVFAGTEGGLWLGRMLAGFQVFVIILNVRRLFDRPGRRRVIQPRVTGPRSAGVGAVLGSLAGVLGIGGGVLAVPMQQVLMRLPLRQCIANSSAVICISAGVGAIYKNATLLQHATDANPITWQWSLLLAGLLAPTAWLGGRVGAALTHRLPLWQVRLVFIVLMAVAAWQMAALPISPF